jgi:diguanylate cyclase (GGDEF)-like protein/hemerythrin-like metal-binding protein
MDTATLQFAYALSAAALAVLMAALAFFRKKAPVTLYALGFASALAGAILKALGGMDGPWLTSILGDSLSLGTFFFIACGLRAHKGMAGAWPKRFWAYLGIWIGLEILFSSLWASRAAREFALSAWMVVLTGEFLIALERGQGDIARPVRSAAWVIGSLYALAHFLRMALLLSRTEGLQGPGMLSPTEAFTDSSMILFLILWAGLVTIIDATGLFGQLASRNAALRGMALTDELTGLSNRHGLEAAMRTETERAERYGQSLALVMFDLDHFKRVNDSWGHAAGDAVLKRTADIVGALIRESDSLYRWGGEEFVVLAPHTSFAGAMALAEKIRQTVERETYPVAERMNVSLGVAEWRRGEDRQAFFGRVDTALYRAKNSGRNRVVGSEPGDTLPVASVRLEWRPEWSSGNAAIDGAHRKLIAMAGELINSSLALGRAEDEGPRLGALLEEVRRHFKEEEGILAAAGYPGLDEHAGLHSQLLKEAGELKARRMGREDAPGIYFDFLVDKVVIGHMLKEDARFFPFTRGSASNAASES